MNLFESNGGETRQQRLALTWSGKNEPESEADAEVAEPTAEHPVEDARPRLILTKAAPVVEPEAEVPEDAVQEESVETAEVFEEPAPAPAARPTILLKSQPPAVVENEEEDIVEQEPVLANPVIEEPEALEPVVMEEPTTEVVQPPPALAEESALDDLQATIPAGRTQIIEQSTPAESSEALTEVMDPDVAVEESATYALPTMNPAEVGDEFKMDVGATNEEKEPELMDEPRKVTLTKAALIPETDEDVVVPSQAVKLTTDNDKTCSLKPRRAKNNTCKLKPDTSEIVADSLGGKLRAARELAGLTEFELAEKTRISSEYITALEHEAFADLPLAPIYVKSYLKTLARQFGLNADELIVLYEGKTGDLKATKPAQPEPKAKTAPKASGDAATSKLLNRSIAAVAAAIVILMIAGVLIKSFGGGKVTDEDLQVITNDELCDSIRTTYLPARHLPIPGREAAAMNDY